MPDDATPAPLDGKASANDAKVRRQTAVTPAPLGEVVAALVMKKLPMVEPVGDRKTDAINSQRASWNAAIDFALDALATPAPLDLDGKPFCPTGYAQRYHAIGECECATPAPLDVTDCDCTPGFPHKAQVAATPAPLDVERLARALRELFPKAQTNQWPFTVEQVAAAIAAAYAGEAERKPDLTNLNVLIGPEIVPIPKSLR